VTEICMIIQSVKTQRNHSNCQNAMSSALGERLA